MEKPLPGWVLRQRLALVDEDNQNRMSGLMPEITAKMGITIAQRDRIIEGRKNLSNKVIALQTKRDRFNAKLKEVPPFPPTRSLAEIHPAIVSC